ncbi:MAG: TetR/AcrR family transcriptional regulator [Mycobacteriaceae bacterium]
MGRPAKTTDTKVLDITFDLVWQRGCDAVSMRDLEVALDIRAPSIYRRFHSRDQLLAAAIDRYVEKVVRPRIRRFLIDADDPLDGVRQYYLSNTDAKFQSLARRGCLLTSTSQQAAFKIPVIREAVTRGSNEMESALTAALNRAAAQGHQFQCAADELALALTQSHVGFLAMMRSGKDGLDTAMAVTLDALLGPRNLGT